MNGAYNLNLVALSYLIAVLAAYTALDMAGRVTASKGRMALVWLAGGAVAMGTGIWSMHFIGMLAFKLPIAVGYDLAITLFSLVAAVIVSAIALYIVSRSQLTPKTVAVGAVLMGTGICIMHYSGMAAMRMQPGIEYDPLLFAASALIAVTASAVALFIAFKLRDAISRKIYLFRGGAALVMGLAIVGMHYTGMAAANFAPNSLCLARDSLTGNWTATPVSLFTIALLAASLALSVLDARMRARAEAA
ncbi:MAG TPA: MHYT domain-containing protein, partial [Candidatus Competibacteraceae bacterium]|nr:MHYT domain-containing protein [Candidatus Competibacteraceae bacterium]